MNQSRLSLQAAAAQQGAVVRTFQIDVVVGMSCAAWVLL